MKALLGLLLLSVLLTSSNSLECETCMSQKSSCSGKKMTCPSNLDACLSAVTEVIVGATKVTSAIKSCISKKLCEYWKPGTSVALEEIQSTIVSFECSKAPISSGSFFLAFSSLLFLKLLW